MVGGSGVRLSPESVVHHGEFFVALDARHDERSQSREAFVRIASAIDVDWLHQMFPHQIRRERKVIFDPDRQRVVALNMICYRDLPLHEDRDAAVDPTQAAHVLAEFLRPRVQEFFADDDAASALLSRLAFLRQWMPEHPWPAFNDASLTDLLESACTGKRTLDEVRRVPLAPLLRSRLNYPFDRLLDEHAPEALTVPSGSRIRLTYSPGRPPVLAVRLQEVFGWTDTPRLAAGRAPVLLHLLGPNFRPVQITDDLRSFWSTTYFQVRKDLRIRYPKHSWPGNPLSAKPEAKGSRRPRP
jgi:ATP-dependent helicase HrpB